MIRMSKFHDNQSVCIIYDIEEIIAELMPTYRYGEANSIAHTIAGRRAVVISADILIDPTGAPGIYYTIDPEYYHGYLVLSEKLLTAI